MANHVHYRDCDIIAALKLTNGKVFLAAEMMGCHPDTIYSRASLVSEVKEAIGHFRGLIVDKAENEVEKAVEAGEAWAIKMTLEQQGRERGWTRKPELDVGNLTNEELAALSRLLAKATSPRSG